jgi:outer membrane autotransporter protein
VDTRQSNSLIKADGYQIGAYGVFDPGAFYVKALGTYNWYDGDSERNINFVPFGGTVEGELSGDPDVRMWTLGAHMGARFMMGSNSALTPFLNIDYTNIKLKGFTEEGLDGPALTLESGSQDRTTVTGGVKWAADIGGVVPEATLGYRYNFGDRTSDFTAYFLDDEDCNFDIVSERETRGSILGGLSLGGRAGPVDVRVAYQGVFNGQATNHAGNFKIVLPFGGSRPAPAPVAYTPPPPPAPVEVAPAPAYTPPPPPPPSSGERG